MKRSDQAAENLGLPFHETFPFQLGNYSDEALHLLIVFDRLPLPLLPCLGEAVLAQIAIMALHHVYGRMEYFAVGAVAVGFAAFAGPLGKSAAKEKTTGGELRDA